MDSINGMLNDVNGLLNTTICLANMLFYGFALIVALFATRSLKILMTPRASVGDRVFWAAICSTVSTVMIFSVLRWLGNISINIEYWEVARVGNSTKNFAILFPYITGFWVWIPVIVVILAAVGFAGTPKAENSKIIMPSGS